MAARARARARGAGGRRLSAIASAVSLLAGASRRGVLPGSAAAGHWWRDRARTQPFDPAADLERSVEYIDDLSGAPVGWQLGADLLGGAGGFASSAGWTLGTGWSISGGVAVKSPGTASNLSFSAALIPGRAYKVTFTVTAYTAGTVTPQFSTGTTINGTTRAGLGVWSDTIIAVTGNDTFRINCGTTFDGTVDNITVREVIRDESFLGPNLVTNGDFSSGTGWTTSAGWSISGGVAVKAPGSGTSLSRNIGAVAGRCYRVTVDATRTAGTAFVRVGSLSDNSAPISLSGSFSFNLQCGTTDGQIYVFGDASFDGTIDNITVREIPGHPIVSAVSGSGLVGSRRVNILQQTNTVSTARTATTVAGSYRINVGSGSVTLSGTATGTFGAGSATFTATAGTLTVTPSGTATNVDIRLALWDSFNLPAYQRVGDGTAGVFDYDDAGFPLHLKNVTGTQAMMTLGTVDMSAGDAGALVATVVKLSDAAAANVVETSTSVFSNSGAFRFAAPDTNAATNIQFRAGGSVTNALTPTSVAPSILALIGENDISTDTIRLTINGAAPLTSGGDQGTGNLGNHRLNIAGRDVGGTASLRFTGFYVGNVPALVAADAGIDLLALSREYAAQGGYTY